jgi:hypothetical protein
VILTGPSLTLLDHDGHDGHDGHEVRNSDSHDILDVCDSHDCYDTHKNNGTVAIDACAEPVGTLSTIYCLVHLGLPITHHTH